MHIHLNCVSLILPNFSILIIIFVIVAVFQFVIGVCLYLLNSLPFPWHSSCFLAAVYYNEQFPDSSLALLLTELTTQNPPPQKSTTLSSNCSSSVDWLTLTSGSSFSLFLNSVSLMQGLETQLLELLDSNNKNIRCLHEQLFKAVDTRRPCYFTYQNKILLAPSISANS